MSNAKRFLSVVLAIIMVCSTLGIGANAAYTAYKNGAITNYNALDQAVLTTDQYASAAMDEVDRMLNEEQLTFTRDDIIVGDVDLTSLDAAMDSVYAIVNGPLFQQLKGMLGDLKNLNVNAFGGVRRTTPGSTDTDVIYALLQFLNDNKNLLTSFVAGTIDLGSIVASLVDISEFADVNKLLKELLYEATYVDSNGDSLKAPDNVASYSIDSMVQDLIDRFLITEFRVNGQYIGQAFAGHTNISTGSMYNFLDQALKDCYNALLVPLLNDSARRGIGKFCGIQYTDNGNGTFTEDRSGLNAYANLINVDYVVPAYNFSSGTFVSQFNNIIKSIADVLINPSVFVWQSGANSKVKTNIVNLAKAALVNTGDDFFASYIEVATPDEVNAMSAEELTTYALRAIINGSVDGMYIPQNVTTLRSFGCSVLKQLLATSIPSEDFSSLPVNTDSIIVMAINFAIYSVNSSLDMGLEYVYDMNGVNAQLKKAAQYGIDNYGGLFSGINFSSSDDGWTTVEKILFSIINRNWLPTAANGSLKTFVIDCLINNILNLDFDSLFAMFEYRSDSELQKTPKQVIIARVASIVNTIFPGAINGSATTLDAIATNSALADTVAAIFNTLWNNRVDLVKSILPTLCNILDLTNAQNFKFPKLTYENMVYSSNGSFGFDVAVRNNSTGINTGYRTSVGGSIHQDQLYTYDIRSVTGDVSGITVTNPGTIAGGESKNIRVAGSISNQESLLKIVIKYDVLTEDGSPLTSTPIEEDVYIVLTKNNPINENELTSTAVGGFKIKTGDANIFAKSVGYITDLELTLENTNTSKLTYNPYSDFGTTVAKGKNLAPWVEVSTAELNVIPAVSGNNGLGKFKPFQSTEAYKALTGEQRTTEWANYIDTNSTVNPRTGAKTYPKYTVSVGAKSGSSTTKNNVNIYLYNDFGLEKIVNSELSKHRQESAYGNSSAWSNYQASLRAAVNAVYSPFTATFATGKAANYEKAANGNGSVLGLEDAILALEASTTGAGVGSLQAIIDSYNPDNGTLEYDDPNYNYFAVADYVDYTYYNYRTEYRAAQRMIDRATIPDPLTGEVEVINELDKAYMEHRLSLYGSRLIPTTSTKQHLVKELNSYTRPGVTTEEWSEVSWANFQRALAFANAVNSESSPKQSKVNTALENLLEAEKRLVKDTGSVPPVEEETFELVDPSGESIEGALYVYDGDEFPIISGITPDAFEPEEYFTCSNCHVEVAYNENDLFSTGATVEIVGDSTGEILATYIVAVYADIDGDCDVNPLDLLKLDAAVSGSEDFFDYQIFSADLDNDEDYTPTDMAVLSVLVEGAADVDYVNRTLIY